jgi:excisionase family DNA binding protein
MRVALVGEPDPEVDRLVRELTLPEPVIEPLLLTGNDIATLLRIGRSKAFAMMAKGELPVVRFGRSVRVPRQALYHWIESNTRDLDSKLPGQYSETSWR